MSAGLISDSFTLFLEGSREMSLPTLVLTFTLTMSSSPSSHSCLKYGQHCRWSGDSAGPLWKCKYNNMLQCYLELKLCICGYNSNKYFLAFRVFDFDGRFIKVSTVASVKSIDQQKGNIQIWNASLHFPANAKSYKYTVLSNKPSIIIQCNSTDSSGWSSLHRLAWENLTVPFFSQCGLQ